MDTYRDGVGGGGLQKEFFCCEKISHLNFVRNFPHNF